MTNKSIDFPKGLAIALGICATIVGFSILMLFLSSPPSKIYAAKVNGAPITLNAYNKSVENLKFQYAKMFKMDFSSEQGKMFLENIQKMTLEGLIDKELYLQYAKKNKIKIDNSIIDTEIKNIKDNNFGGDLKMFRQTLTEKGYTEDLLRKEIKEERLSAKVKEQIIAEKSNITEKEQKDYYDKNKETFVQKEEVKASHILVKTEKEANEVTSYLAKGVKFEDLAQKYSTDTSNKDKGGDLGFFAKGVMVPEFEKAAWELKNGEISKPVKTQFGFHIIKKVDSKVGKQKTFEEAKQDVLDTLKREKSGIILQDFIKEQREKAKIINYVYPEQKEVEAKDSKEKVDEKAPNSEKVEASAVPSK